MINLTNQEISENLGKYVIYNGSEYILNAYILRVKGGKRIKQCELQDKNTSRSILIVNTDKLEVKK